MHRESVFSFRAATFLLFLLRNVKIRERRKKRGGDKQEDATRDSFTRTTRSRQRVSSRSVAGESLRVGEDDEARRRWCQARYLPPSLSFSPSGRRILLVINQRPIATITMRIATRLTTRLRGSWSRDEEDSPKFIIRLDFIALYRSPA